LFEDFNDDDIDDSDTGDKHAKMEGPGEDPGGGESVIVANSCNAFFYHLCLAGSVSFLFSLVVNPFLLVLVSLALMLQQHRL
jgi:hypothetical protein